MSGSGFTDWQDIGIFPLQDHDHGVPLSIRQMLVGGRIVKLKDDAQDPAESMLEYGRENGMGTLGDMHPYTFWQTSDRASRGMGSWSPSFAALTIGGGTGGERYGTSPSEVRPIRNRKGQDDTRYAKKTPGWPFGMPSLPKGTMVVVMSGTEETKQEDIILHADPRLVAVNASGPGQAGTLVVDLQPDGEMCMGGSSVPGYGGRQARLQSLIRVIPMRRGYLGAASGNILAINHSVSSADALMGYGAIFGRMDGKKSGPVTPRLPTPITPPKRSYPITPRLPTPITPQPRNPRGINNPATLSESGGGDSNTGGGDFGTGGGSGPRFGPQVDVEGRAPNHFGRFSARAVGGHGVALTAAMASGPIHPGSSGDKHRIGSDADGHPINAGHISTGAYFYEGQSRDGPFLFEGSYPNPPPWPLTARTHLTWDAALKHAFVGGPRDGMWRWWTEVPYVAPTKEPGKKPGKGKGGGGVPGNPTPGTPSTPTPGTPSTPGPPPTSGPGTPSTPTPGVPSTPTPPTTGPGTPSTPTPPSGPYNPPSTGGGRLPTPITPQPRNPHPQSPSRQTPTTPREPYGPLPGRIEPDKRIAPTTPQTPAPPTPTEPPPLIGPGVIMEPDGEKLPGRSAIVPLRTNVGSQVSLSHARGILSGLDPHTGEVEFVPGIRERVGDTKQIDVGLYSILHPMQEAFGAMTFRPQLWIQDYPNFEHNPQMPPQVIVADETVRPQVLAMRAWGAQDDASGDWSYVEQPHLSRARGGTGNGGLLLSPPHLEMEDYFGIGSAVDVTEISTTNYFTAAPGVSFALGLPNTDGTLASKSIIVRTEIEATNANRPLRVTAIDSGSVEVDLIHGELDQSSGEVIVGIGTGGVGAIRIPRGTQAQRPSALTPVGGELRIVTDGGADQVEFWDQQGGTWTALASGGGATSFLGLTDTPANYSGAGLKAVRVNAGATALEYIDLDTIYATDADLTTHKSSGDHDGRYYTEVEVDNLLAFKSDTTHTHEGTAIDATAVTNGDVLTADGAGNSAWVTPTTGVTDHGALTGLGGDDHTHYHTDARGDARYYTKTELGLVTTPGGASLIGVFDTATHYATNNVEAVLAEIGVSLATIVTAHSGLSGLGADDHTHYHTDARGDARYYTQTQLGSVANALGASLIGIEDPTFLITAIDVEGALVENRAVIDANTSAISQNQTDIGTNATNIGTNASNLTAHQSSGDHDGQYYTQTLLGSTANAEGARLIGIEDVSAYWGGETTVEGALDVIGAALGVIGTGPFLPLAGGTMTGAILGAAGTALLPGYSFTGDPNTGLWSPAADTVAISLAGAEELRLTTTGLGLGVTPATEFHIHDGAGSTTEFLVTNSTTGATAADGFRFRQQGLNSSLTNQEAGYMAFQTNGGEVMRIDSSYRLGIGTTSPAVDVELRKTTSPTLRIRGTGVATGGSLQLIGGASGSGNINFGPSTNVDDGRIIYGIASQYMAFWTADTERMRIDSAGYVGIGLAGASALNALHVKEGTAGAAIRVEGELSFGAGGRINFGDAEYVWIEEDVDDLLQIHASKGIRLTQDSTSYYSGIGTGTTRASTWDVGGSFGAAVSAVQTSTYTAGEERLILCDTNALGAFTVTLPAASTCTGRIYSIKKVDSSANVLTVTGNASETLDGVANWTTATQYDCLTVMCDGSNWHMLNFI